VAAAVCDRHADRVRAAEARRVPRVQDEAAARALVGSAGLRAAGGRARAAGLPGRANRGRVGRVPGGAGGAPAAAGEGVRRYGALVRGRAGRPAERAGGRRARESRKAPQRSDRQSDKLPRRLFKRPAYERAEYPADDYPLRCRGVLSD